MFQVLKCEQLSETFFMQSKSQDQEVDYIEHLADEYGEDRVASQLFIFCNPNLKGERI